MPPKKSAPSSRILQLKITLLHVKPAIWRRLLVRDDLKLPALAPILESAMGWESYHLHEFKFSSVCYGIPDKEFPVEGLADERKKKLNQFSDAPGFSFGFTYDFGDGWEHEVEIEDVLEPEAGRKYPVCLDGARACPPEDCGGFMGYAELVKAMKNPKSKRRKEFIGWLGVEYDPEEFDLDKVNSALSRRR